MKAGIFRPNAKTRDRIARWISFLALVALLAMATLPITSGQRDVAANHIMQGSDTWHG
jgi:hypothetical protein